MVESTCHLYRGVTAKLHTGWRPRAHSDMFLLRLAGLGLYDTNVCIIREVCTQFLNTLGIQQFTRFYAFEGTMTPIQ